MMNPSDKSCIQLLEKTIGYTPNEKVYGSFCMKATKTKVPFNTLQDDRLAPWSKYQSRKSIRLYCSPLKRHINYVREFLLHQNEGNTLILESIDLAKGRCFPKSPSFDRYIEIMTELQILIGHPSSMSDLKKINQTAELLIGPPLVLEDRQKRLPAFILRCQLEHIVTHKIASRSEVKILIKDLMKIADSGNHSVSLLAINQIRITKLPSR